MKKTFLFLTILLLSLGAMAGGKSKKYMVTITYTVEPNAKFNVLLPDEKKMYADLLAAGKIEHGFMVPNHSRGWIIFDLSSKSEVMRTMQKFPLYDYMKVEIEELDDVKLDNYSL